MTLPSDAWESRLQRLLVFLSAGGGAALVTKRGRRIIGAAGDVEPEAALTSLDVAIHAPDDLVRFETATITDVGLNHRLVVFCPGITWSAAFAERIRRARAIIERFALPERRSPPIAPPSSTPAHAVVFPDGGRRSS